MGMLRHDEFLIYFYRLKDTPNSEIIKSKTNDLDPEVYTFVGTYRRAFVGDMQQKIDEMQQRDNMRHYAETGGRSSGFYDPVIIRTVQVVYRKRPSIFRRIVLFYNMLKRKIRLYMNKGNEKKYFSEVFREVDEESNDFFNEIFNKQND